MDKAPNIDDWADDLYDGVSLLARRLHQAPGVAGLSLPERSALARLERGGPSTTAELARAEQITPQAMANTLGALEARGLVSRRPHPDYRRRVTVSVTTEGIETLRRKRDARGQQLAAALAKDFTAEELTALFVAAPLIRRLAEKL
ncbi:MarR family winged helix-turn-helix transcriptional regulator [Nocardia alni]|uniref:MarR family winged helix-turn-helix transcriptional regulator n=1 Tax=Nocardia alni TaxID=2815723 RepID=UPI001C22B545|nr:MarR family transcriptional regulator [Nocardia alni]